MRFLRSYKSLFLLIPLVGIFSSNSSSPTCVKHVISGTIQMTNVHQGGVEIDRASVVPAPYVNTTFYVVSYTDAETVPVLIESFTTDATGRFSVSLKPGKYGIITANELNKLTPGLCFPVSTNDYNDWQSSYSTWESSHPFPLDLTNSDVVDLVITNQTGSICYACP
jgi:hypothetical protein